MNEENKRDEDFWYDEDKKILMDAMLEAEKAFKVYINDKLGLDGSYWELELTGYVLSTHDFSRMKKIKFSEVYDENLNNVD